MFSLKIKNLENYVGDIVTNMNHRSGVYDSPMAQDYYVRYLGGHYNHNQSHFITTVIFL